MLSLGVWLIKQIIQITQVRIQNNKIKRNYKVGEGEVSFLLFNPNRHLKKSILVRKKMLLGYTIHLIIVNEV